MNADLQTLRALFARHGQDHVFSDWDRLSEVDRASLIDDAVRIDFDWLASRRGELAAQAPAPMDLSRIRPAPVIELPKTDAERAARKRAAAAGAKALREGKAAAFLVAGGQGTRLGYDGPKGCYAIGPVTAKPLFAWHAERIGALGARYGKAIPWYIMTSRANDAATRVFFESRDYFGLNRADVFFFQQAQAPSVDEAGRLIRSAPGALALNPDGHGGSLSALVRSKAIEDMKRRGIETISYFQVDNPLAAIADPEFLGLHLRARAEMSSKVLAKIGPEEKVGHIVLDGRDRLGCVEYSDLPEAMARQAGPDGRLRFWAGSIAIHMLSVDFVDRVGGQTGTDGLPWHVARKKIPYWDGTAVVRPEKENGVKFETFVFDALPLAKASVTVETARAEEFAPVKNACGADSPASCRALLSGRFARWLEAAGVAVPREADGNPAAALEISPRYALDAAELKRKIGKRLIVERALALG